METVFDDLTHAVKVPQKSARLAVAFATFVALATVAGVGVAIKSAVHTEPRLPTVDIGQVLHPGVI